MRAILPRIWNAFSAQFEGTEFHPYLDTHDPPLVTTGRGNLIDPVSEALVLPWRMGDNGLATADEVIEGWTAVKSRPDLAKQGAEAFKSISQLRLLPADVDEIVLHRLDVNDLLLGRRFSAWELFSADAQAGILSMVYAMGVGRLDSFPKFCAAANAGDWLTAAEECHMDSTTDKWLEHRNETNKALFTAAATTTDPDQIFGWSVPAELQDTDRNLTAVTDS